MTEIDNKKMWESLINDTLKFAHEECGGKGVVDELKDIVKQIKGE